MTDSASPGVDEWVRRRLPAWQRLDESLAALEDDKAVRPEDALDAVRQYPEIARDLAVAKRAAPGGRVNTYLESTYARLHRVLFAAPRAPLAERLVQLRSSVPAAMAELKWHVASVTALFLLAAAAGWWLVATYPELVALFASEQMIETVRQGRLWTDDMLNVFPSSVLSVRIFANNIVVALMSLCLGLLYGLGTLYIIGLNGLMLGGVFAFTTREGQGLRLFEFVSAHGFVELSVICIAGAAGFYAGEGLARPGMQTRIRAVQQRLSRMSPLIVVCVVFLVGAGIIEGYVSPDPRFGLFVRLIIGLGYLALFLFVLAGAPTRSPAASGESMLTRDAPP